MWSRLASTSGQPSASSVVRVPHAAPCCCAGLWLGRVCPWHPGRRLQSLQVCTAARSSGLPACTTARPPAHAAARPSARLPAGLLATADLMHLRCGVCCCVQVRAPPADCSWHDRAAVPPEIPAGTGWAHIHGAQRPLGPSCGRQQPRRRGGSTHVCGVADWVDGGSAVHG